ncbi:MAG: hypothetical protein B6A08_03980 [Sorangiineae bacterium NIC37A_2]|jgi:sulfatase modifying factor 1|nr:MAG: hypothetical protein B6A08_03980 [Sorangiineae bacterium NIC37A_2]
MRGDGSQLRRAGASTMLLVLLGCSREQPSGPSEATGGSPAATLEASAMSPPLGPPVDRAPPRVGMSYIPPGALVVGTPPDRRPRRADREVSGEQVMLQGYYIDIYSYPNEEGAIPVTNVTQAEARALCAEQGKRLCTELEWERACKGPDNRVYEYGDTFQAEACRLGSRAALRPSGYYSTCQSDFGVHDLHGGPFEWTESGYGRGYERGEVVLKGGSGSPAEVHGRCANLEPEKPEKRSGQIGFRCCLGDVTSDPITLEARFAPGLLPRVKFDADLEEQMLAALPDEVKASLAKIGPAKRQRVWLWRPIANEELHLMAVCARAPAHNAGPACGLSVVRVAPGTVKTLAWISSGKWVADLHKPGPLTHLMLLGGDERGSFKRSLIYKYGDVAVGDLVWGWEQARDAKKRSRSGTKNP